MKLMNVRPGYSVCKLVSTCWPMGDRPARVRGRDAALENLLRARVAQDLAGAAVAARELLALAFM
jgi:hypothetical protein